MITNLNNYKPKKKLGQGMIGTTFLVYKKGKKYALKIEHILKKDVKKSLSSPVWREIEFAKKMGKKYPDQFMTLYGHDIIDKCKHKQKYAFDLKMFPKNLQKGIKAIAKSPYCARKLWSLIDFSLHEKLNKLNTKQIYSAIIQITNICYLMKKHGYSHNDLHPGNIGIKKTKKKYITIFSKRIPTFGYIYVAIDYGLVLHKKYKLNKEEKKKLKDPYLWYYQIQIIVNMLVDSLLWKYINKNKIKLAPYEKDLEIFKKHSIYNTLKKFSNNVHIQFRLCEMLFPEIYQQIVLKKQNTKKILKMKYKTPKEDVFYIMSNIDNYKNIVHYFAKKL